MSSNLASTVPALNGDGTISAVVREMQSLSTAGTLLRLWLPLSFNAGGGFGRFFLVRCAEDTREARRTDWSIYARRALFCAAMPTPMPDQAGSTWELSIPITDDPGYRWLATRPLGSSINLLGPFGLPFQLAPHCRALLVLTDIQRLPLTLPAVHSMLERNGRVTMLVKGHNDDAAALLPLIPIPVELRVVPADAWMSQLAEAVRWADQLCAALPNQEYIPLSHHIRTLRFQLDNTFANVLVESDIVCGVGACLACVIAIRDGSYTRACLHGPVFPLATLAQ
jgi:hypothetical protein